MIIFHKRSVQFDFHRSESFYHSRPERDSPMNEVSLHHAISYDVIWLHFFPEIELYSIENIAIINYRHRNIKSLFFCYCFMYGSNACNWITARTLHNSMKNYTVRISDSEVCSTMNECHIQFSRKIGVFQR